MRRLSGLDSLFLSLESPTNLLHVGAVALLDPATAASGSIAPYDAIRQVLSERMHLLPRSGGGWRTCRAASIARRGSRIPTST